MKLHTRVRILMVVLGFVPNLSRWKIILPRITKKQRELAPLICYGLASP
jgi:hypothetical protein